MKKIIKLFPYFKILISIGLIGFLFYKIPASDILGVLRGASIPWFLLALFIGLVGFIVSAFKLFILLRLKNPRIAFSSVLRAYYVGFFFNNFMPTSIGGDVFKANELRKNDLSLEDVSAAVFLERFCGIFIIALLLLFFSLPGFDMFSVLRIEGVEFILLAIAGGLIGAASLIYFYRQRIFNYLAREELKKYFIFRKLAGLLESFFVYKYNFKIWFSVLGLSLAFHLIRVIGLIISVKVVYAQLSFAPALFIIIFLTFLGMIPISIGGLGVREGTITYFLVRFGISSPQALSVALLGLVGLYLNSLVGGFLYARGR